MEVKEKLYRKKGGLTKIGEAKLVEKLAQEVNLSQEELNGIIHIYKQYLHDTWYMDMATFSKFLHNAFGFNEEFFIKRIFLAADTYKDHRIDMEEFMRVVAIFLRGSAEEKIKFCFTCYDLSENNELTRDDITALLVESMRESPYEEINPDLVRDLSETMVTKMDEDLDGVISFEEFKKVCLKDWVLMEAFGQCLPDFRHRAAFLIILENGGKDYPYEG